MSSDSNPGIIAVWGAITGTAALGIQIINLWHNRASFTVEAWMQIQSDTVTRRLLQVRIVNVGHRPLKIRSIETRIKGTDLKVSGMPAELQAQMQAMHSSSTMSLFDSNRIGQPFEISPDGGEKIWTACPAPTVKFESQTEGGYEFGCVTIATTSGKRRNAKFQIIEAAF